MQFQSEIQNKLPLWGVRLCITHTTATSGRIYPYRAAKQQAAGGCSRCRTTYVVCLERLAEDTDSDTCLGLLVPTP